MAVKKVIRMGHPTLRKTAAELTPEEITSEETKQLIQDLFDTMQVEEGIGIAAPQIDVSKQVALVGLPGLEEEGEDVPILIVINPKIDVIEETPQGFWEGCLSVPGLRGFVERPRKIRARFFDPEGNEQELELEGFPATVFQHEIDHLFGKLYVDRISDTTLLSYNEEFDQFAEHFEAEETE